MAVLGQRQQIAELLRRRQWFHRLARSYPSKLFIGYENGDADICCAGVETWAPHASDLCKDIEMLTVGDTFPSFNLKAVKPGKDGLDLRTCFTDIDNATDAGKWKIVFFWPKDFTFVCPTEIVGFGKLDSEFADRDAVGATASSTDSEFVHLAWRLHHDDLRDLPFPMLADIKRELSAALGILDQEEGVALRATFIVDPQGIIRFASVNDLTRRPQPAGSAARARCAAERRAVPLQLEARARTSCVPPPDPDIDAPAECERAAPTCSAFGEPRCPSKP